MTSPASTLGTSARRDTTTESNSRGGLWLGLDLGTTNVKVVVLDDDGRPVGEGTRSLDLYRQSDGTAEQDIEQIWDATRDAICDAGTSCGLARVQSIGVSSQGGAIQLLDGEDRPRGRVISWMDSRGTSFDAKLLSEQGRDWMIEHTGCAVTAMVVGQLLRLRQESPALIDPPHCVGFVGDVIVGRLCGRRAHDATSLAIACLRNPRRGHTDDVMLAVLGLKHDQLPQTLSIREPAGELRGDVAKTTGLPAGIPVSPALHDQYAAALAAGAMEPGDVMLGTGTAWVLLAIDSESIPPPVEDALVAPHLVPQRSGQIVSLHTGGAALDWARQLTGCRGDIDALVEPISPGSDGLCFWPFLSSRAGAGLPVKPAARLSGLHDSHRGAHVVRAVLEGLAFEFNRILSLVGSERHRPRRVLLTGGATAGHTTPQLIADVTGLPIVCVTETATSARGAAVIARGLVAPCTPLAELRQRMPPTVTTVSASRHADTYRELFHCYITSLELEVAKQHHD